MKPVLVNYEKRKTPGLKDKIFVPIVPKRSPTFVSERMKLKGEKFSQLSSIDILANEEHQ